MLTGRRRLLAALGATLAVATFGLASISATAQESVTATVEVAEVAISVTNPNVDFGTVGLGETASTLSGATAPTVTNDGNVDLNQLVVGYDYGTSGATAVCTSGTWTANATATTGTDAFFMAAYTWENSPVVIPTTSGTGVNVLGGTTGTTLAPTATFDIDLNFAVPSAITTSGPCTADLEVLAVAS